MGNNVLLQQKEPRALTQLSGWETPLGADLHREEDWGKTKSPPWGGGCFSVGSWGGAGGLEGRSLWGCKSQSPPSLFSEH